MIKVKDIVYNYDVYIVEDKITSIKLFRDEAASVILIDGNVYRISVEDAKRLIQELEKKVS